MDVQAIVFGSVLDGSTVAMGTGGYLLCTAASLVLGLVAASFYSFRHKQSKSLLFTVALLPAMVQLVIMLVNGNIGAGIAVMGAFSLVRFRSIPGNARDIAAIFLSMAIGLATGMGYLGIATVFAFIMGIAMIIYTCIPLTREDDSEHELKVLIPENLDYEQAFGEIFEKYTKDYELQMIKTIDMGSLYQLRYKLCLKQGVVQKELLDELRTRNGNLEIVFGKSVFARETI
ncbi:MAG: DUF4956 domain-containing protein [Raoultibacter sp.]|jgi:hypothetical protein